MNTQTNIKAGSMNFWKTIELRGARRCTAIPRGAGGPRAGAAGSNWRTSRAGPCSRRTSYPSIISGNGKARRRECRRRRVGSRFDGSPLPTFVLNTGGQFNTIEILDTRAGVPIQVNTANHDLVNVGNAAASRGSSPP